MKYFLTYFFLLLGSFSLAQQIQTQTLIQNINASGGVTTDKVGNIYVSDFGPTLPRGNVDSTKVYKVDAKTGEVSVFADGFIGASGACFDNNGVFYQSNVFGKSISKVFPDGKVVHNWVADSLNTPIGLAADQENNIYVCNCASNNIGKINPEGEYQTFATSDDFKCPNGLTIDPKGNLYACNFGDGNILKITPEGDVSIFVELPTLKGGPSQVGNGHLTWKNGYLFVTTIGTGEIYRINQEGKAEHIVGTPYSFKNTDGTENVGFSKPNGIAASVTGDTLYVNVSDPTWISDPQKLHPAHLRMISGICGQENGNCGENNKWIVENVFTTEDGLPAQEVRVIQKINDKDIWVGTKGGGAAHYINEAWTVDKDPTNPVKGGITCVFLDSKENVWFGSVGVLHVLKNKSYHTFSIAEDLNLNARLVFSIYEDKEGMIWAATTGGAAKYNGKKWTRTTEEDGMNNSVVHDIAQDNEGNFWFATRKGGLNIFRPEKGWEHLFVDKNCRKIMKDKQGNMWVGSSNGLIRYADNKWSVWEEEKTILPAFEDKNGHIWCTTATTDIVEASPQGKIIWHKEFVGKNAQAIFDLEIVNGKIWAATEEGIIVLKKK